MIDEVFRKNKTTQKIADAEERFLKISPMPDGSKVVDTRSSRLTYVADPVDDKDAINKSWATKYFKEEKDAVTKLSESATAKSAEIDDKLVKFKANEESIEKAQGELKALNEDMKTKLEDASTKLNETIKHIDEAKSKLTKFNEDYANTLNINTNVESKASEVKADLESIKTIFNNVTNMGADIVNVYNRTKQDIASTKASIDTKANEALNTATSSLNEIKTILNDFKGKQTELNALKASLESLKSSLENLSKSRLINDTEAGTAQTYSSSKIDNLLQGVKNESDDKYLAKRDASVDNTASTLVKRGADKNISANNIKISDTGSDIEMVRDIERDAQSPYQLLIRKSKDEPIKLMNLQNFIGRLMFYTQGNIDKAVALCLKKTDKIDAYTKKESDKKFALKDDLPPLATETKVGIVKLKNVINAKQTDTAVTEKAVSDLVETKINGSITDNYAKLSGGFIIQWGKRETPNSTGKTIFPIAFPNKCLHVMIIQFGSGGGQATNEQYVEDKDNTGFIRAMNTWSFYWVAFGY